jgi:HSP20 family protein
MSLVTFKRHDGFPSIFDELLSPDFFGGLTVDTNTTKTPSVNIKETDASYVLDLAVPGLKKEDFTIELDDDVLTISSEVSAAKEDSKKDTFTRKEFSYASFKRSFTLPENVDVTAINAAYTNGVLSIEIPKKELDVENSKRLIEVS